MSERTLAIVKPDAVKKNVMGDILSRYEKAGLRPIAMKLLQMSKPTAEGFYAVHKARPFFDSLCTFMCSGPSLVMVLQGENAIKKNAVEKRHSGLVERVIGFLQGDGRFGFSLEERWTRA